MNCQNLESVIIDLARDRIEDATEREVASRHLSECRSCAASFADQRALSAGLGGVKALSQNIEAPASLESVLRLAFQERGKVQIAVPASFRRLAGGARFWAVAAAACVILLVLVLAATRLKSTPQPEVVKEDGPKVAAPSVARPDDTQKQVEPAIELPELKANNRAPRRAPDSKSQRRMPQRVQKAPPVERAEIATEFISIGGPNAMLLEGGRVVRVELPRSALVSFGLPMNMERADQRIKADVVVGNDGMAHAIRFVR
jgi:hypothetical protein